jgi:hypothetical protein
VCENKANKTPSGLGEAEELPAWTISGRTPGWMAIQRPAEIDRIADHVEGTDLTHITMALVYHLLKPCRQFYE